MTAENARPPGARRSLARVTDLADAIEGVLSGARGEVAAAAVLDLLRANGGPVGETEWLELQDLVYGRLRERLSGHWWWLFGPKRVARHLTRVGVWWPEGGSGAFVEFGCGRENPLALSVLMWLNGARSCLASDLDPCEDEARAALGLHDLLVECLAYPDRFRLPAVPRWRIEERVRAFDLERLRQGELAAGLADVPCRLGAGELGATWRAAGAPAVDLLASFSVLEHAPLERTAGTLAELVRPGGRMVHEVDFRDHRSYASEISAWGYLLDGGPPQEISNELRCSEVIATVERAGFRLLSCERTEEEPPPEVWRALREKFRALPARDVTTQQATLVFERSPR